MSGTRDLKVCCVGMGHSGPDLFFVTVRCTEDQMAEGDHYKAAKEWCEVHFDCEIDVCIDDADPGKAVMSLFNWDSGTVIDINGNELTLNKQ